MWFYLISLVCLMVFNTTFNNISVISLRSVLLMEDTSGPGEYHRPAGSDWQTISHNVCCTPRPDRDSNISGDWHWLHRKFQLPYDHGHDSPWLIFWNISETKRRSQTPQKREEKKFGEYVCVRTWQSGNRTSWGEFWLFCTCPCQPTWRSSFSVYDSVKFLIRQ